MKKIGIIGYGNLGRGVEKAILGAPDMCLEVIFTRRPENVNVKGVKVEPLSAMDSYRGKLDVVICCGGSATDLPTQTPMIAEKFNFVDSFDHHADIPQHFNNVNKIAKDNGTVGVISAGWDPGLFSIQRLYGESVLPNGTTYTFWGTGVSQGHSEAVRNLGGVAKAIQYTVPAEEAMNMVREGTQPALTTRQKHKRVCYVVAKEGADKEKITSDIVNMPDYFSDYDTTVNFISLKEFEDNHNKMPHGGFVFRTGKTSEEMSHTIEYSLKLANNPEFTGSVLVAYARAVARLASEKASGVRTVLDVPPAYLSPKTAAELYKELL